MTATLPPPTGATTLTNVDIDAIQIDDGFNPRTSMDDAKLAEITASVRSVGIIQPVVVTPSDEDGRYRLVAGHRRVAAARAAELREVPSLVYDSLDEQTRLQLALIENLQREDINPIDEAAGYERAMRDFALNQKQLAEMVGKSASHISERLRLRKLPDACQQHIATGALPLTAVKPLTQIAKVAPAVADGCARLVTSGEAEVDDLVTEPHYVVSQLIDVDWDDAPFLQPCRTYGAAPIKFRSHIDEGDVTRLNERAEALGVTRFSFTEEDIDAARAYGCLLEFEHGYTTQRYITDARFSYDRLSQALDHAETAQAAEIAAQAAQEAESPDTTPTMDAGDDGDALVRAKRLEERRVRAEQKARATQREQQEQQRLAAITANRQLGVNLAKKLGSKDLDRDTAQILAQLVLHASRDLAARGVRLTHEEYHELQHIRQKNGKVRTKFTPIEPHAADQQLEEWMLRPKQPAEIIGRLLQALIAGTLADQEAITKAQRTHWSPPTSVAPMLAKLAAKLVPDHFKPTVEKLAPAKPKTQSKGRKRTNDAA